MTPVDCCDRCGKVMGTDDYRATLGDRELLLCFVHKRDHEPALVKQGWKVEPYALPTEVGQPLNVLCVGCKTFGRAVTVKVGEGPWVRVLKCERCD